MKKIVFLCRGLGGRELFGIHRNTFEMLKAIDSKVDREEIELLIPRGEEIHYDFKNIRIVKIGRDLSRFGKIGIRTQQYLYKNYYSLKYFKKGENVSVDLLLIFPWYGCDVLAMYDCIPEIFKDQYVSLYTKSGYKKRMARHKNGIRKAKIVITDSKSAMTDIRKIFNTEEKPIIVIPCAWQHESKIVEDCSVMERLHLRKEGFFFSLGSRLPHKNIKWISCAAKKNPDMMFVVTGSTHGYSNLEYEGEIPPNMIFTGYLSDGEIKCLMRNCKAFIQPSLYEGFGIPPMEAMSVGADCIVSNVASLPEVYKNSVWYIDPYDYENIDLDKIMEKPKDDNELILNEYSWEKSAASLLRVLKEMAQ